MVGQKIAQLELRKRAAVEREDYDTAKQLKADMDKLRAAGESAAGVEASAPGKNPDEIFSRVLKVRAADYGWATGPSGLDEESMGGAYGQQRDN